MTFKAGFIRGRSANAKKLTLVFGGRFASSAAAGSLSGSANLGAEDPNRNVVAIGWSNDSNSPVPNSCTVGGVPCTRVVLLSGAGAMAIFITNAPVPTGATASVVMGWSGSNVANRSMGVYAITGDINRTPGASWAIGGSSYTANVKAGGVIVAGVNLRNSTLTVTFTNLVQDFSGTVASSHRDSYGHYQGATADETRTVSMNRSGGFIGAVFNPA